MAELRTSEEVLSALVYPRNNTRTLLAPMTDRVTFPGVSSSLLVVDTDGSLSRAAIDPTARSVPGPVAGCGWLSKGQDLTIPMERPVGSEVRWLRVGYLLGADAPATLRVGETSVDVDLEAGLNSLFVRQGSGFDEVRVLDLPDDADLCVDVVEVGRLVPGGPA